MRNLFLFGLVFISLNTLGQEIRATTEDGKKVILKTDKTWDYDSKDSSSDNNCGLDANFKEPKGKNSLSLRMSNATTKDLKKHVAVENDCKVEDIILIDISEQAGNGMYTLCVKGKKMKYRRMGSVFSRLDEDIFNPKN